MLRLVCILLRELVDQVYLLVLTSGYKGVEASRIVIVIIDLCIPNTARVRKDAICLAWHVLASIVVNVFVVLNGLNERPPGQGRHMETTIIVDVLVCLSGNLLVVLRHNSQSIAHRVFID